VTENEWFACQDPTPMLDFLRGKASNRKLRLFACACVRRVWHLLPEELTHEVVRLSEDFADGKAASGDLGRFRKPARKPVLHPSNFVPLSIAVLLGNDLSAQDAAGTAEAVTRFVGWECRGGRPVEYIIRQDVVQAESKAQAMLLRDIFGNPFRPTPPIDSGWLTPAVVGLAQRIHDDRAVDRLSVLADALEAAGCHDTGILGHLRDRGPHCRGCFVLDGMLGKS
jgi:hypothetical protein